MKNYHSYIKTTLSGLCEECLIAKAEIKGASICSCINGAVLFYAHGDGIFAVASLFGLPTGDKFSLCIKGSGTPIHLSDVYSNGGYAFLAFYTESLTARSLIGKTLCVFDTSKYKDTVARGMIAAQRLTKICQ